MKTMVPAPGARWLRSEVDRLFDKIWDSDTIAGSGEWIPRLDFTMTPDALTVRVDVPGIEPKDIHIVLEHELLIIRGTRPEEPEINSEQALRLERRNGPFTRRLTLPVTVDTAKVSATFKNGVVTIVMPKAAEAKGTTIPIRAA